MADLFIYQLQMSVFHHYLDIVIDAFHTNERVSAVLKFSKSYSIKDLIFIETTI